MRNVVILGMHRSGTSMVAGALATAGLYAGEPDELLADQSDNPHGFWERRDVVSLNDAILSASSASWFNPPEKTPRPRAEFELDIGNILASMPSDRSHMIKDPRLLLTWPIWESSVAESVLLFVYRDPYSVAASLRRRHGFPYSLGLALWEYYNQRAIELLHGSNAVSVSYQSFVQKPDETLSQLLDQLNEFGVNCKQTVDSGFFDATLGHSHRDGGGSSEALLSDSQRELASYCEALCAGGTLPVLPAVSRRLLPLIDDLATALAPLARVLETAIELDYSTRLCEERTSERDKTLAQLKRQESEHRSRLNEIYGDLLGFELSFLAGVWRFTARCFKLLTLRRGVHTSYDDTLADAREHFEKNELEVPHRAHGKLLQFGHVVSYVVQNPAASARSFSFERLKRAAAVFLKLTPDDLDVWVSSRFPTREEGRPVFYPASLDKKLDQMELVFPLVDAPKVSIVVPVYNDYRVTKNCLKSILKNSEGIAYEVIIGDDCSTDLTASITDRVANITVVRHAQNRGFLGNCNEAATIARGEYILFLNNDTVVSSNWLGPLVDVLDRDPTVGIVGPKLVFGNGKLQEAGGIVWKDGSAWNYGRMDDPEKTDYNYVKEVDYISGACLLIRAGLWQHLDGFDARYMPAYYEDTDIAFEARAAGYKVVYQPLSCIFHFEGVSHGSDTGSGIKQYQVQNQAKFRQKWRRELDEFHFPNAQHVFQARDRSRNRRSVLFIDHYVPHYDNDAGSRSTFMYIQLMLEMGYKVLFMGANFFPHKPYTEKLQQMGVEVLVGEHMARNQDHWLKVNAPYIDRIYLHRPHIAEQFLGSLEKMVPRPPIIFFGHDLHYLRVGREQKVVGNAALGKSAQKWRKREYAVFDRVDKIYYPSQVEIDEIAGQRPDLDLRAIPLYVLEDSVQADYRFDSSADILFVGGFNHPPNVDGICWFVDEVLPLVHRKCPDVKLHVVGSNPTDAVQDLQCEAVMVYGYLSDEELDALYRRVRQVVVPLRFGAGVKGKILEAIQKNVPLVTTTVGAEGIPDAHSVMSIVDTAQEFADRVVSLEWGDAGMLAKLDSYSQWLRAHFSRGNASRIILEDFGPPLRRTEFGERPTQLLSEEVLAQ